MIQRRNFVYSRSSFVRLYRPIVREQKQLLSRSRRTVQSVVKRVKKGCYCGGEYWQWRPSPATGSGVLYGESADWYLFGNTQFFSVYRLPQGNEFKGLFLGIGDIRHILATLADAASYKQKPHNINLHLDDVVPAVLARDAILLTMVSELDCNNDDDMELIWSVWYNIYLRKEQLQRLNNFICKILDKKDLKIDLQFGRKKDENAVREILRGYLKEGWLPEYAKVDKQRKDNLVQGATYQDSEKVKTMMTFKQVCQGFAMGTFNSCLPFPDTVYFQNTTPEIEQRIVQETENFYESGAACLKEWYAKVGGEENVVPNPTMLDPRTGEYKEHYSTSPFTGYMPYTMEQAKHWDKGTTDNMLKASLKILRNWIKGTQHLLHKGVKLSFTFWVEDGLKLAMWDIGEHQFDAIWTSNITDFTGMLNILLVTGPRLKRLPSSRLYTSSTYWSTCTQSLQEYFNWAIGPHPSWLPTLLNLRLVTDLQFSRRRPAILADNDYFEADREERIMEFMPNLQQKTLSPVALSTMDSRSDNILKALRQLCEKCLSEEKDSPHQILCTTPFSLVLLLLSARRLWMMDQDVEPLQQQLYGLQNWLHRAKAIVDIPKCRNLEWRALWAWLLGIKEGKDAPAMATVQLYPNGVQIPLIKPCIRMMNVQNQYEMLQFDVVGVNNDTNEGHFFIPFNHGLALDEWMICLGDLKSGSQVSEEMLLSDPDAKFSLQSPSTELFEISNLYTHSRHADRADDPIWNHIWLQQTDIKPFIFEKQHKYDVEIPLYGINTESLLQISAVQQKYIQDKKSKKFIKKKVSQILTEKVEGMKPFLSFPQLQGRAGGYTHNAVICLNSPEIKIPLEFSWPIVAQETKFQYLKNSRTLKMSVVKSDVWPADGKCGKMINPYEYDRYENCDHRLEPAIVAQFLEKELQELQRGEQSDVITPSVMVREFIRYYLTEASQDRTSVSVIKSDEETIELFIVATPQIYQGPSGLPLLPIAYCDNGEGRRKYSQDPGRMQELLQQQEIVGAQVFNLGHDETVVTTVDQPTLKYLRTLLQKNKQIMDQKKENIKMGVTLGNEFKYSFLEPLYVDGPSVTNLSNFSNQIVQQIGQLPPEQQQLSKDMFEQSLRNQGMDEERIQQALQYMNESVLKQQAALAS